MAENQPKTANDLAIDRTDLAVERTIMAASRTLMAWVRTGLSMISFGFTIYKFLQAAAGQAQLVLMNAGSPKRLGLFLIGLGTLAVVFGSIEYLQTLDHLKMFTEKQYKPSKFTFGMGIAIGLLGLFLFVTILTNHEVF